MHKCTNCGKEFDGNFCPMCGLKRAGDIICPQCGSKGANDMNFCPMCGHKITQSPEDDKPIAIKQNQTSAGNIGFAKRLNSILRHVPMVLALLFALLLPLLYIAPIAEANEMFGSSEYVNVYSLNEDFFDVSVAYLVFMGWAFLLAAVMLILYINKSSRQKYITVFGKVRISIGELIALSAVILVYLPCIIISAVAMGRAAELNEMLGGGLVDVVYAGAAPKAVLSLAVIFTVFAILAALGMILIGIANPEQCRKTVSDKATVQSIKRPFLYYAYLNAKLRRASFVFFLLSLLTALVLPLCFWGFLAYVITLISPHWIIVGGSIFTLAVVIFSMIYKPYDFSPEEFLHVVQKKYWHNECRLGIKKAIFFVIPLAAMIITHIATAYLTWTVYGRGYIMATVYIGVTAIVYVVAKIAIAVQSGHIAQYLFGVAGPAPNSPLKVEFDINRELEAYNAYKEAKKHSVAIADGDYTNKRRLIRRLVLSVACIVFVAITVVSAVVSPLLVDKFSASFVSRVVSTCREHSVYIDSLLGTPNEVKDLGNEGKSSMLIYYDDDYAALYERVKKLQKKIDNALSELDMNEMTKLNAELETLNNKIARLEFNSMTIAYESYSKNNFDVYGDDLVKVALNTKTCTAQTASKKKIPNSVELFGAYYSDRGYTSDSYYVEIFYTDGSYKYERVSTSAFSAIDFSKKVKQTVKWSDEWGSYSATVKWLP